MNQESMKTEVSEHANGGSRFAIIVTVISIIALCLFSPYVFHVPIAFLMSQVVVISLVIWQACDPFADAAQWVGEFYQVPGSVRGATLDAIASSMPELFSGIFFVVVAISATSGTPEEIASSAGEGYGATLATCAGSAIYNMILIPAFVALVISFYRKSRPTVDVEPEVITRDGMWFLACEMVLIIFLFQDNMYWWMGVVLLLMYVIYVLQLYGDTKRYQRALSIIQGHFKSIDKETSTDEIIKVLDQEKIRADRGLIEQLKKTSDEQERENEEDADTAGIFYGMWDIPLNHLSVILILLCTTLISAAACYWLVEVTRETAATLDAPVFFVAVILAAAASSVPDTFLSIGASMRGDDSGAVSNAFGSNIFDICVCLSIPLLVNSYLLGWEPVALSQNGQPIQGLVDLRILLALLTVVTLLIMWHNRQLTRTKALFMCALYGLFIAYAIAGSMGVSFASLLGMD